MTNESIKTAFQRFWEHTVSKIDDKSDSNHTHTADSVGADPRGSANAALESAKAYTDQVKSDILGGAPKETLDTIAELATAFEENAEVIEVLNQAIVNKADVNHTHSYNDLEDKPFYTGNCTFRNIFIPSYYEDDGGGSFKKRTSMTLIRDLKDRTGIDINVPTNGHVTCKRLDIIIKNDADEEKIVSIDNPVYVVNVEGTRYPSITFCHSNYMPIIKYRIEENDWVYSYVYNYFATGTLSSYGIDANEWGYNSSTGWLGTSYYFDYTLERDVTLDEKYVPDTIARKSDIPLTPVSSLITEKISNLTARADLKGIFTHKYQQLYIYNDTTYNAIEFSYGDSNNDMGIFGTGYMNIRVKSFTDVDNLNFEVYHNNGDYYYITITDGVFNITGKSYVPKDEVLTKTNKVKYTPTSDYNPATKKYVDDKLKNYYSKNEIDNLELITIEDIDEIWGETIQLSSEVTF